MATSPEPQKPTIVIVQGSFQLPDVYHPLARALEAKQYPIVQPVLPSVTNPSHPSFASTDLISDALAVRSALTRLVEYDSKTVIVVMHSYGGLVGSEAIPSSLTHRTRQQQGLAGGVLHLFFAAAFILPPGHSIFGDYGDSPTISVSADGARFSMPDGAKLLYDDLPEQEAQAWERRMVEQSYAVQKTELTRAAWEDVPSTYLVCTADKAVPPAFQRVGKDGGGGSEEMDAGHSPMLSRTGELAGVVAEVVEGDGAE